MVTPWPSILTVGRLFGRKSLLQQQISKRDVSLRKASLCGVNSQKVGCKETHRFKPISLIGSVYRIISNVLTERLKKVMHKIVDTQQLSFIKGRQIMDAILMANEGLDFRIRSKVPGILCKLDIKKAYDHLNWNFLLETLSRRGFGGTWMRWIKFCISTVKYSVLINGSPTGFFSSQR
ncbi:uncharacterized protein LOC107027674 [Solanum pennellii]|uniref:Uncharacterized protein LOC107027674 n=1 Tax=Solanum pennellii TaxID=28526 RepID=A0ABM1HE82_SOLPN|nr:uncharacterized protein LOC107027674 [Solanum pennellii]